MNQAKPEEADEQYKVPLCKGDSPTSGQMQGSQCDEMCLCFRRRRCRGHEARAAMGRLVRTF